MRSVAVVPAAGRGSRLGASVPKLLVPIDEQHSSWSLLRDRLLANVDHVHVVLSPEGAPLFQASIADDPERERISWSVQPVPRGMGDAIFSTRPVFAKAATLVVVWGDQVALSADTIGRALAAHGGAARRVILPTTRLPDPYVEYRFDGDDRLSAVLQAREGDATAPGGAGDVGAFVLATDGLAEAWDRYEMAAPRGRMTDEVNFLPFLVALAAAGWEVTTIDVPDAAEARGLNAADDLAWIRERLRAQAEGIPNGGQGRRPSLPIDQRDLGRIRREAPARPGERRSGAFVA